MKEKIQEHLKGILGDLYNSADFDIKEFDINIQENKEKEHGDLASNIALVLAKPLGKNPKEIADQIKANFFTDEDITKVEVAGPGFINFFLSKKSHGSVLKEISVEKDNYGASKLNNKTNVSIVSRIPGYLRFVK